MGTTQNVRQVYGSILSIGIISLSLVGCSSSSSSETAPDTATEIKAATQVDPQAIEKVNTLFNMSPAAQQAKEKAIAQCLQQKGLTWQERPAKEAYSIRSQLFPQPLSVEDAQQYGYEKPGPNLEQDSPPIDDAVMEAYMGNPENGRVAVEGVSGAIASDGCLAQSYKAVFGSAEAGVLFESGISNLPLPYIGEVQSDPKVLELDKQWATCMKDRHDIEIANPDLASVNTSMDSKKLAVYDAQCRQEVKYEEGTVEVLNAYLTTFLADEEGVIDQLTQAKQTAEKNAPAILGGQE